MSYPAHPVRPSRAPTVLIVVGAVTLALALVVGGFAAITLLRAVPTNILTLDGRPGADVIVVIDNPGTGSAELDQGADYSLMLVAPAGDPPAHLDRNITVTTPAGEQHELRPASAQSLQVTMNGRTARSVATLTAGQDGTYTFQAPAADRPDTEIFLTEAEPTGKVVAGIFGSVLGVIVAVFLGVTGAGLLAGGVAWRVARRSAQT